MLFKWRLYVAIKKVQYDWKIYTFVITKQLPFENILSKNFKCQSLSNNFYMVPIGHMTIDKELCMIFKNIYLKKKDFGIRVFLSKW